MAMMKLKHNVSMTFLSNIFGCSITTCTNTMFYTIRALSKMLSPLVVRPCKDETFQNMPNHFKKYESVKIVIDCTEVPASRPKCLKCAIPCYSFYKKRYTCKYIISVTPAGLVAHVSKGYWERASDKTFFEQGGIVDSLLPGIDSVMVDRVFLIDSLCENKLINIVRPPFKKEKQMSRRDALQTQQVASARVRVQRAIQRMKVFRILVTQVTQDHIIKVIAGITNLSAPILGSDTFL